MEKKIEIRDCDRLAHIGRLYEKLEKLEERVAALEPKSESQEGASDGAQA